MTIEEECDLLFKWGYITFVGYECTNIMWEPPGLNFDNSILYNYEYLDGYNYRMTMLVFPNRRLRSFGCEEFIYIKNYFKNKNNN